MNMFKSNGGFTLVELIVVIAILAILAGIAVPAYSGYIKKANEAADYTQLDAVKTAAVFEAMESAPGNEINVTKIVFNSVSDVDVTGTNAAGTTVNVNDLSITDYVAAFTFKTGATSATWVKTADATNNLKEGWNLTIPTT